MSQEAIFRNLVSPSEPNRTCFLFESTTIYLDSQKGVWYKGWEVSDCSATGGGAMGGASGEQLEKIASNIQLVDSDDVILFEENVTTDEVEGYQSGPSLNEPLYLLAGSIVEYQFCLTSNSSAPNFPHVQSYGEFLIFNDVMNYANYIHRSGESGKESAIFYRQTLIPSTVPTKHSAYQNQISISQCTSSHQTLSCTIIQTSTLCT